MQIVSEVFDSLIGQKEVIPSPVKVFFNISSRFQRLQKFYHVQIWDIKVMMLWCIEIFLCNNDTLFEEVFIHLPAILL